MSLANFLLSDDCAEVRRKIGLLQKTPGWKVSGQADCLLYRP